MTQGAAYAASAIGSGTTVLGQPGQGLGSTGNAYPWGAQPYGSGGSGGTMFSDISSWAASAPGGAGGGCLWLEAAGSISLTGTILVKGSPGGQGGTYANSLGQPTLGAGGARAGVTGSGGGSGGLCLLSSLTSIAVASTGTIDVSGGVGGNGFTYPSGAFYAIANGGYGGTGGYVVLMAPNVNTTGASINLNGGLGGAPSGYVSSHLAPRKFDAF